MVLALDIGAVEVNDQLTRKEALRIAERQLEAEVAKGYAALRSVAPVPVAIVARPRLSWLFRRTKWKTPSDSYVVTTATTDAGEQYWIEREVDWDDEYGGPLRVLVYVHDGTFAESPECATNVVDGSAEEEEARVLLASLVEKFEAMGSEALWDRFTERRRTWLGRERTGANGESVEDMKGPEGGIFGVHIWASLDGEDLLHVFLTAQSSQYPYREVNDDFLVRRQGSGS